MARGADQIAHALNERGKAIKASKILVLGLACKKNVDDVREPPAAHAKLFVDTRGHISFNENEPVV